MKYPPNFHRVLKSCDVRGFSEGHSTITMNREGFIRFLQGVLNLIPFDEAFYLSTYPDVKEAVDCGEIESAHAHYMHFGYFEGRLPHLGGFDAAAYLKAYEDLSFMSEQPNSQQLAETHFIEHGYGEGRESF